MTALSKFLVLLAIFLLANSGDAFMNLSSATGNLVPVNHWIRFVEPMSKPTKGPTGENQMNRASKHPYIKTRKVQFIGKAGCRASKQDYCFDYSIYFRHLLYI
jgi:hypothetical protein